jgi:GcrA cell cycle regulator
MSFMWTYPRTETLRQMAAKNASGSDIAAILGTTRDSVTKKARRLGVQLQGRSGRPEFAWLDEHIETMRAMANERASATTVASVLGITRSAVLGKAKRLGVKFNSCVRVQRGPNIHFSWPPESLERLKECCEANMGSTQIAQELSKEFAFKITPNAVRSKSTRLGLTVVGSRSFPIQIWRTKGLKSEKRTPKIKTVLGRYTPIDPATISTVGIAFSDLSPRSCRYPLGDPGEDGFQFCGSEIDGQGSYCAGHRQLCYMPSKLAIRRAAALVEG